MIRMRSFKYKAKALHHCLARKAVEFDRVSREVDEHLEIGIFV
jgi:hypothetical protein